MQASKNWQVDPDMIEIFSGLNFYTHFVMQYSSSIFVCDMCNQHEMYLHITIQCIGDMVT